MFLDRGDGMKILYRQSEKDKQSSLYEFGIQKCYYKELALDRDGRDIIKKCHSHTGFEMHLVTEGCQIYEVAGVTYTIKSGQFLLIYPNVSHIAVSCEPNTHKYSVTFQKQTAEQSPCFFGTISERMQENVAFIQNETRLEREISATLIENNVLETIVLAFRLSGAKEKAGTLKQDDNAMISIAKQYIEDNIQTAPTVADVARYCYLSTKQLTRIFQRFEGVTPGEYIMYKRVDRIEKLLADPTLTLKQISSMMHFENEYYFNAFFKKHAGMPPGAFRKTLGK